MECPVEVLYDGQAQTPQSLVKLISNATGSKSSYVFEFRNEQGQSLTLRFHKSNDVFGHYASQGNLRSSQLPAHPVCHFATRPESKTATPSTLSLCSSEDVAGLLPLNHNLFYVGITKSGTRRFVLHPQTLESCDFSSQDASRSKREAPQGSRSPSNQPPKYYADYVDRKIRYVELALIADQSIYKKYNEDEKKVHDRLMSIATNINALYYPLNIRVSLAYMEVWKDADIFEINSDGDKVLDAFLAYRKKMFKEHPHDNAHFLTNTRFNDGVVGKAFKGTMCSYDYSGGVNVDHADNAAAVASTVAHEMGHNFGMEHDDKSVCACPPGECIMAPASGYPPHTIWSECSLQYLSKSFSRGVDLCLWNRPNITSTEAQCGNGIVETGEECDCGHAPCNNECCDEKTCQLKGKAKCATGECCDLLSCQPKAPATVCRDATGICDLPEFCNGETADCPADFFVQNGLPCPERNDGHCYDGVCGSRNEQCEMIWGPSAADGVSECYAMNLKGIFQGNCGYDPTSKGHKACTQDNAQCGRLQCATKAERPVFGDSSSVTPGYHYTRRGDQCHVIQTNYVGGIKNKKDPGMVPDGAVCGSDKICINTNCQSLVDLRKMTALCKDNCHDRGICNNVGNCHCENGFGGIACQDPGYGGSVNSNAANLTRGLTPSLIFLILLALLGFVLTFVCIYFKVKKKRNLIAEWWKDIRHGLNLHGELVPIRKAPPPPGAKRGRSGQDFSVIWNPTNGSGAQAITVKPNFYAQASSLPPPPPVSLASKNSYGHLDTYTFAAPASPLISPHNSDSSGSGGFSRTSPYQKSDRPKVPPPSVPQRPRDSVIQKLYNEHGDEIGLEERIRIAHKDKPLPPIPIEDGPDSTEMSRHTGTLGRPTEKPPPPPPPAKKPALKK